MKQHPSPHLFLHAQNDEERELSAQMQVALEAAVRLQTFPKANVDIYALVLESGGADLAVCICAAGMALADAGIEMEDMVSACSVVSAHHTTCHYTDEGVLITRGA